MEQKSPYDGARFQAMVPTAPGISARWAFSAIMLRNPGLRRWAVESRPVRGFFLCRRIAHGYLAFRRRLDGSTVAGPKKFSRHHESRPNWLKVAILRAVGARSGSNLMCLRAKMVQMCEKMLGMRKSRQALRGVRDLTQGPIITGFMSRYAPHFGRIKMMALGGGIAGANVVSSSGASNSAPQFDDTGQARILGPYSLYGYSFGCEIAAKMCRQFDARASAEPGASPRS